MTLMHLSDKGIKFLAIRSQEFVIYMTMDILMERKMRNLIGKLKETLMFGRDFPTFVRMWVKEKI